MKKNTIWAFIQVGISIFLSFFGICGFIFEIEDTLNGKFDPFGYGLAVIIFILGLYWFTTVARKSYPTSKVRFIPNTLYVLAALMFFFSIGGSNWLSGMGIGLAFAFAGLMVTVYQDGDLSKVAPKSKKKRVEKKAAPPASKPDQKNATIDLVLSQLSSVEKTRLSREDETFNATVKRCLALLRALKKSGKHIPEYLLTNMQAVNTHYLRFEGQDFSSEENAPVRTEKIRNMTDKLIESYSLFEEALENLYDKSFEKQSLEILSDIEALEQKLEMDGLLDSDFKDV